MVVGCIADCAFIYKGERRLQPTTCLFLFQKFAYRLLCCSEGFGQFGLALDCVSFGQQF